MLEGINLNVHPGRFLAHPPTACHILTSCTWGRDDWLNCSWSWANVLSCSWYWTTPRARLAGLVDRQTALCSWRETTNFVPLKVKLDLLGASLRDLPYLGSVSAQPLATWRGYNVRPRDSPNLIQYLIWLPLQYLGVLNGHLLSWNQAR